MYIYIFIVAPCDEGKPNEKSYGECVRVMTGY